MHRHDYTRYRELQDVGWDVDKHPAVKPHSGPETLDHFLAKAVAVWIASEQNMRVTSECPIHDRYTADVLVHGDETTAAFVIEFETEFDELIEQRNLDTYNIGPVAEVFTLNIHEIPDSPRDMAEYIQSKTWL